MKEKITACAEEYNHYRPHSSLREMTPAAFIEHCELNDMKTQILPEATLPEAMHFVGAEHCPALQKNNTFRKKF